MFLPLTKKEIHKVADLLISRLTKNVSKQHITLQFTPSAMDMLTDLGYEPQYGARPMARVIQKEIVNVLARHILSGLFGPGDQVFIDTDNRGFVFSPGKKAGGSQTSDSRELLQTFEEPESEE
jgi:ATP-dependent Clp protease ATP-binding subunit ClpB